MNSDIVGVCGGIDANVIFNVNELTSAFHQAFLNYKTLSMSIKSYLGLCVNYTILGTIAFQLKAPQKVLCSSSS